MALINKLVLQELERDVNHSIVDATYSIVTNDDGKFLQIDTYGSNKRQIRGKKSQSFRLSEEAINELKIILEKEF